MKLSVKYKVKKLKLPPNLKLSRGASEISFSVKAGFHVLHILRVETLISAVAEETRRYLFNA